MLCRNDSSTIEVDITSLRRLLLKGSNLSYDSLPSSHNDLHFERLAAKFKDILGVQSLSQDLLITLGLYQHREGYTIAGELLADTNTYPGVDIAKFGGTINIINDRILLNHMSILDQYDKAVEVYEITLPVVKRAKDTLPKEARYIYNLVRMGCSTSRDLMKETGFGKTKLLSILNTLAEHNYIQKQGNARATVYKVI